MRYAQEAAFEASASAGYDHERYTEIGQFWLIRETALECFHPLHRDDLVEVRTYVADFRRVRSRRAYEFRLAGTDGLVARAHTDWVFLHRETQRPTKIPPEMMTAFYPEGVPEEAPPRRRFPQPPAPPPDAFRQQRWVEWSEIDGAQHVNNAAYLMHVEDCRMQALASRGWSRARLQEEGLAIMVRSHRIEYLVPALLGDGLEITTWLSEVDQDGGVRHTAIERVSDGKLLTRARTVWGAIDAETEQPVQLPTAFLTDLAPGIAG
jgi:acyl-CoA thioester hydrolase